MYISLTEKCNKPIFDFEPARKLIAPQLAPHEFRNAKIAFSANYTINANWKLVYENNRGK
jgi:Rieske 2Fe-2S family protein